MRITHRIALLSFTAFLIAVPALAPAQEFFYVTKQRIFTQTGPTTFEPDASVPCIFGAGIEDSFSSDSIPTPPNSFTAPGGGPNFLSFNGEEWNQETDFGNQTALDLAFPNGPYALASGGGTATVNLNGNLYPNVPLATMTGGFWNNSATFTGGFTIAPNVPLTITTNAFSTNFLRNQGIIMLRIQQIGGGPDAFEASTENFRGPTGAPVKLTVPAGTLLPNTPYEVNITFVRLSDTKDFSNNDNYEGFAGYISQTSFEFFTSGPSGVAPFFTTQPTNATVLAPGTATFKVAVQGTGPFTYQWQYFDTLTSGFQNLPAPPNNHYSGVNSATLSVKNTNVFMNGLVVRCVVTGPGGTTNSNIAQLVIHAKPAIVSQPSSQTVIAGGTATFSVTASGTGPLSYQWKQDGKVISGETGPVCGILFPVFSQAKTSVVTCTVTNTFGSITTAPARVTIVAYPAITTQPASRSVLAPAPATFTVKASGTGPLTYQWKVSTDGGATYTNVVNNTTYGGATTATLTVRKAGGRDTDLWFVCIVSNGVIPAMPATTVPAKLTVVSKPVIIEQPENISVKQGNNAFFEVEAEGTPTLTYVWKKNGVVIPGETMATLTLNSVNASSVGSYTCVVSNGFGTVTSKPGTLKVGLLPTIVTPPQNRTVVAPASTTFAVSAGGTAPFTYQWQRSTDGGTTFFNIPNGGSFSGVTTATLKVNPTGPGFTGSQIRCIVANPFGDIASPSATFIVRVKPVIIAQPGPQAVIAGQNATFSVGISPDSTVPLTYQWKKNGVALSGKTNATLFIEGVGTGNAGTYTCTITNSAGTVTSLGAKLIVTQPAMGVFSGNFSGPGVTGQIAAIIQPDDTAQVLAFSPGDRSAVFAQDVTVNPNGSFAGAFNNDTVFSGTATSTGLSGSFTSDDTTGTFTGKSKSSTGFLQSSAGFYIGNFIVTAPDGPSGMAFAIVGADGSVFICFFGSGPDADFSVGGVGKITNTFAFTGSILPEGATTVSLVGSLGSGGTGAPPTLTGGMTEGRFNPVGAFTLMRTIPLVP